MAEHWDPEEQEEETHVYLGGGTMVVGGSFADLDNSDRWFISRDGIAKEVLTAREIIEATQSGALSEHALVWRDGLGDWTPLGQVPELMAAVHTFVPSGHVFAPAPPRPLSVTHALPPVPSLPPMPMAGIAPLGSGIAHAPGPFASGSLPSYSAHGSLPPLPAFAQPGLPHMPGHTNQPFISDAPSVNAPIGFWDRVFDVPGLGPTNLRAFVVFGGLLIGGIALGALLFSSGRSPKPLVISGDVVAARDNSVPSKEAVSSLRSRQDSQSAGTPAANHAGSPAAVNAAQAPVAESLPAAVQPAAQAPVANVVPIAAIPVTPPQPAAPRPVQPAPVSRAVHSEPAPQRALVPPPAAPKAAAGPEFDVDAVKSALSGAASRASRCQPKGGPTGTGSVRVTIAPSGSVSSVEISTPKFDGTPTGNCVQMVFRQSKVPAFGGGERTVNKKFTIPDPEE